MPFPRASGILLHPTSLPGRFGIGDLGPEAYRFVDFLEGSGQQLWQILPLGPTGYGNSPYMSYSAMAGNPLLISLELLRDDGLLTDADLEGALESRGDRVDFDVVEQVKTHLLRKSYKNLRSRASSDQQENFVAFCKDKAHWLDDYALFISLKAKVFNNASWHEWDEPVAKRDPATLDKWRDELAEEIDFRKYLQYEFFQQWSALKKYANDRRVQMFGDIPFYVAHDSSDVWAHREIFCLDEETGKPSLMAGVPPDYFSETGQLWGNPIYNWEKLLETDLRWWMQRFHAVLDRLDLIRIDHFRGFEAYWAVPGEDTTAMNGEWVEAPGYEFFEKLKAQLGELPIVAEDLGIITPEVEALRDTFGFPGMKILHFAFDSGWDNPYLPFNYGSNNFVVYTGTHDNNTTMGWYNSRSEEDNQRVWDYLGCTRGEGFHWDLIRLALSTNANQAVFPLQDLLGLGEEARMNAPSSPQGNWEWRYQAEDLTDELRDRLRFYTMVYGRGPRS
ncbi:4-alpha-glucanotransferase [Geitlerinema sp. P-1104]|uniref:4-alpha-glucanotransferase n=1 Tax=Geitlerinema sp. P-1104 TaxID=2546230 RepID=UPI0014773292|nr:4-alpha-glucanotransferase [Geitlerinema sp. P-1104]NMG58921.1 4-alpha-glucanotransferase [Geitlerinema sp. P-1104]